MGHLPSIGSRRLRKKASCFGPLSFRLRGVDVGHPYLTARGVATQTAADFGMGFYAGPGLQSRLVIPIHDAAKWQPTVADPWTEWSLDRSFPPDLKSQVLFDLNLHRAAAGREETVTVAEVFFDCLRVHQAGLRPVVALMGRRYVIASESCCGRFSTDHSDAGR